MSRLNIVEIQNAIYDWVLSVVDPLTYVDIDADNIVWREQSVALPPRPCIGLKLLTGPMRTGSFDDVIDVGDDVNCHVSGQREMSVSIQVYGNSRGGSANTNQVAADLSASLTRPTILQNLIANGIAIFDIGDISDISAVEESEYEERHQFDIKIGVAENIEDAPGFIETVGTISGTYRKEP